MSPKNPKKRGYVLPKGQKNLGGKQGKPVSLLKPTVRVNGRIRSAHVAVRDEKGNQLGVFELAAALELARSRSLDLIETDSSTVPPICVVMDYGKFRWWLESQGKSAK